MKSTIVIALTIAYAILAFGLRSYIQMRRTGSFGVRIGSKSGAQRIGGGLLVAGFALAIASPIVFDALDTGSTLTAAGALLFAAGFGGTLYSQLAMGISWRIGVDPKERTPLVTAGPFQIIRNPIFTSMISLVLGIALLAPSVASAAGALLTIAGIEIQVRLVEEPYLRAAHGPSYASYAARVGRFLPGIGKMTA